MRTNIALDVLLTLRCRSGPNPQLYPNEVRLAGQNKHNPSTYILKNPSKYIFLLFHTECFQDRKTEKVIWLHDER